MDERRVTRYDGTDPVPDGTDQMPAPAYRRPAAVERTYVERDVTEEPPAVRRTTVVRTGPGIAYRIAMLLFGLVQLVILLRIVLLLIDARPANAIVSFIYDTSQLFVAPFDGILRTNALSAGAATLDVAAIVALVGWTVLEIVVLAIINTVSSHDAVA